MLLCRTREKSEKCIACLSRQSLEAMILSQNEVIGHRSRADEVFGQDRYQVGVSNEVIGHSSWTDEVFGQHRYKLGAVCASNSLDSR